MKASSKTPNEAPVVARDSMQRSPYKIISLDIARKGARQYLVQSIERGLREGVSTFKLRIAKPHSPAFPGMCVPIGGVIDYYIQEKGCRFLSSKSVRQHGYLYNTSFLAPKRLNLNDLPTSFLDCVWRFTRDDEYEIVTGMVQSLREKMVFKPGMLEGIELCLHEVMDNVLNHSVPFECRDEEPVGYVMVQCGSDAKRVSLAVYDNGQGILRSFESSGYNPKTNEEAIELALRKNVTSGYGAGRGMWMLARVIELCGGSLEVSSGSAKYLLEHLDAEKAPCPKTVAIGSDIVGTTSVDFFLDAARGVDLVKAFEGYEPTSLWHEAHEQSEATLVFDVAKESHGTGTRHDARRFRNVVRNAYEKRRQHVILDFGSVRVMSSSYADELIARLIDDMGHVRFMQDFSLNNLSPLSSVIVDEALASHIWKR